MEAIPLKDHINIQVSIEFFESVENLKIVFKSYILIKMFQNY